MRPISQWPLTRQILSIIFTLVPLIWLISCAYFSCVIYTSSIQDAANDKELVVSLIKHQALYALQTGDTQVLEESVNTAIDRQFIQALQLVDTKLEPLVTLPTQGLPANVYDTRIAIHSTPHVVDTQASTLLVSGKPLSNDDSKVIGFLHIQINQPTFATTLQKISSYLLVVALIFMAGCLALFFLARLYIFRPLDHLFERFPKLVPLPTEYKNSPKSFTALSAMINEANKQVIIYITQLQQRQNELINQKTSAEQDFLSFTGMLRNNITRQLTLANTISQSLYETVATDNNKTHYDWHEILQNVSRLKNDLDNINDLLNLVDIDVEVKSQYETVKDILASLINTVQETARTMSLSAETDAITINKVDNVQCLIDLNIEKRFLYHLFEVFTHCQPQDIKVKFDFSTVTSETIYSRLVIDLYFDKDITVKQFVSLSDLDGYFNPCTHEMLADKSLKNIMLERITKISQLTPVIEQTDNNIITMGFRRKLSYQKSEELSCNILPANKNDQCKRIGLIGTTKEAYDNLYSWRFKQIRTTQLPLDNSLFHVNAVHYDLIIIDTQNLDNDFIRLAREIKKQTPDTRLLAWISFTDRVRFGIEGIFDELSDAGFDQYVYKQASHQDFLNTVFELLEITIHS